MKTKRKLTVVLTLLMAFCMLFSSCFEKTAPDTDVPTDSGEHTNQPDNGSDLTPVGCNHASTTLVNYKASTCTEAGYTGDKVCSACGEIVEKGSAAALIDHDWDDGMVTKAATCIEQGIRTYTCLVCSLTENQAIATVAHDNKYHDALDGTHMQTCTTCTMNKNSEHDPVDAGTYHAASCTEAAYTEFVCADCLGVYKVYSESAEDAAIGHAWGGWVVTKEANCAKEGAKTRACTREGCNVKESIPVEVNPNAHVFLLVETTSFEATCTTDGEAHYTCKYCDATKDEVLPATGIHDYEVLDDQGDGWTVEKCASCGLTTSKFTGGTGSSATVSVDKLPTNDTGSEEKTSLDVSMGTANIQFPAEVIEQMKGTEGTDVSIGADIVDDSTKTDLINKADNLDQTQKDALANADLYDFNVLVGDTKLSNFNGAVTVTLPYTLKDGEDPDGIVIWYVTDDGEIQSVSGVYNAATETVVFTTNHFSYYAIAYEETQEIKCKKGLHAWDTENATVVPASCEQYGYTVLKCTACHYVTVDAVVEKLGHDFGDPIADLIEFTATCTEGGHDHYVCADCGYVKNEGKFKRALGHDLDRLATCTEDSSCERCDQVVTPALGHRWTAWDVVVRPGEVTTGLRRRSCPVCGEIENVTLAATGNIEQLKFESYQELYEFLFDKAFGSQSGKLNMAGSAMGVDFVFEGTMTEEDGSYLMLLKATVTAPELLGTEDPMEYSVLYKNGIVLGVYSMDGQLNVEEFDLDQLIPVPFDVYWNQLEQLFTEMDPAVAATLLMARETLAEYTPICSSIVNAALEAAGSAHTVEELVELLDTVENTYAYLALKLGFTSEISMNKEDVELPQTESIWKLISACMTETVNDDGTVTYVFDFETFETSVMDALTEIETVIHQPLNELLYNSIEASITKTYPDLTDWEACYEKFCESFPGSMTVKDAVNRLIPILEESGICTLDELYEMIDEIVIKQSGETDFSVKAMVNEYRNLSLDDLVAAMFEDDSVTAEMFYEQFNEVLASMTLNDLLVYRVESGEGNMGSEDVAPDSSDNVGVMTPVDQDTAVKVDSVSYSSDLVFTDEPSYELDGSEDQTVVVVPDVPVEEESGESGDVFEMSLGILIEQVRGVLDMIDVAATFEYTLDADGNLISLDLSETVTEADDGDASTEAAVVESLEITFGRDENVTVVIPEEMKPALNGRVGVVYDANGNLVISGLDASYDYSFGISGGTDVNIADVAIKDDAMTEEMGFDVYVLPEGLWNYDSNVGNLIQIGDQYYKYTRQNFAEKSYVKSSVNLRDLFADPLNYCPDVSVDTPDGYYKVDGMSIPVYQSWFGPIYQMNNEWQMALSYNTSHTSWGDGRQEITFDIQKSCNYADLMKNVSLSTVSDMDETYSYNGETIQILSVTVDFNSDLFEYNRSCRGYIQNDTVYLVDIETPATVWYYVLTEEVTALPEYDHMGKREVENDNYIDLNEQKLNGSFVILNLWKRVPTYYVKVDDGNMVQLYSNSVCDPVVEGLETLELPNEKTLYVLERRENTETGMTVVFGYTKIADGVYVQTAVEYFGEELQKVIYRSGESIRHASFGDLYDVESYLTENTDGSYTVSAALIQKLKADCDDEGDMYYFTIVGNLEKDGVSYSVRYHVGAYAVPEGITGGMIGGSEDEMYDYAWEEIFGSKDGAYGYETALNEDGSLSIYFRDGRIIENLSISMGGNLPATENDVLVYDRTENGLPIYRYEVVDEHGESWLLKDGKYYRYITYADREAIFFETEKDLMLNLYIRNLTYRYDYKDTATGKVYPVYEGELAVNGGKLYYETSSRGLNLYFLYNYETGVLYTLRGAVNNGESELVFEEMVTWAEYVEKLSFTWTEMGGSNVAYFNGVRYVTYTDRLTITELDANGDPLLNSKGSSTTYSMDVRYVKDGETKRFVRTVGYGDDIYLEHSDYEITVQNFKVNDTVLKNYKNGDFTICNVTVYNTQTFDVVKLADGFYNWDEYNGEKIGEAEFLDQFKAKAWCYEVKGNYYASYSRDENGFFVPEKALEALPTGAEVSSFWFGDTADGYRVTEYTYYLNNAETFEEQVSENIVYHYTQGCAFLEIKEGSTSYYIEAYKVTQNDGSEKIFCKLGVVTVPDKYLVQSGAMDAYISLSEDGKTITVSADALEFLEDYRDFFSLSFDTDSYSDKLNYDQLENLFLYGEK